MSYSDTIVPDSSRIAYRVVIHQPSDECEATAVQNSTVQQYSTVQYITEAVMEFNWSSVNIWLEARES